MQRFARRAAFASQRHRVGFARAGHDEAQPPQFGMALAIATAELWIEIHPLALDHQGLASHLVIDRQNVFPQYANEK